MLCHLRLLKQTNIFKTWSKDQEPWRHVLALISSENLSRPWTFLGLSPLKCRMKDLALGYFQVSHSMINCLLWWLYIHSKVCFLSSVLCPKVRTQQDVRPRGPSLMQSLRTRLSRQMARRKQSIQSEELHSSTKNVAFWYCSFCYPNSTSCWQGYGSPRSHTLLVGM